MLDLDEDLLALAGGDQSEDEPMLAESDEDADAGPLAPADGEEEDDGDDDDEPELVNPYPLDGKYKDEVDRAELEGMDEMARELILYERLQEMQKYTERKFLVERARKQKQLALQATRSLSRTTKKTSKDDKLSELKKQREKKRRRDAYESDDAEEDEDEEDEDEDAMDEDEEDDYDDYWGGAGRGTTQKRLYERATVEDINKVAVGRTKLFKHCYFLDFAETVIDCFGKISLGMDKVTRRPLYRMVKIVDVQNHPEKAYRFDQGKCDVFLTVLQNRQQRKEFPLLFFSDLPISGSEFDRYIKELDKTNEDIDYADDVADKATQLSHLLTRGVSDKDVNEMIAKKQKLLLLANQDANLTGYDAVTQKARLKDELKVCKQQGNMERAKALAERIARLDEKLAHAQAMDPMAKLNERNRKLNQHNIRAAELKNKLAAEQAVQDDADPFARLRTTTRIYYQDIVAEENQRALDDAKKHMDERLEEQKKEQEQMATLTYRVLGGMDNLIASNVNVAVELQL